MKSRSALLLALLLAPCVALHAAELTIQAAASLTDVLKEIGSAYEKQSGDKLNFNFGASNMLARQIEEGAPADIFFSADEARMDSLGKKDLLVDGTRKSLLSNTLVIVVSADNTLPIKSASDLTKAEVKRVALAEPQSVPAGIYAKEYLQKIKLWGQLSDKIVPTENVRGALAAVESDNVDAGMVYKTDALISKKVRIACEVPRSEGPKISYPMALLKASKEPAAARKFLAYLESKESLALFQKYGFIVTE